MDSLRISHYRVSGEFYEVYREARRAMSPRKALYYVRLVDRLDEWASRGDEVAPCGGTTEVQMVVASKVYVGVAHCSLEDNYCRRVGVVVALGNLLLDNNALSIKAWSAMIVDNLGEGYLEDAWGFIFPVKGKQI